MKTKPLISLGFLLALVLLLGPAAGAQAPAGAPSEQAARFVQKFYDGYLAKLKASRNKSHVVSPFELTLKEKAADFSPDLLKALKDDLEAAKQVPDEIVGLDFDPFLNSQDMGEKYAVGGVTQKGDRYWVEVFGYWEKKKSARPDITPEVAFQNGRWVFTNFHYSAGNIPVNENLLSILQQLKNDRNKKP